MAINKNPAFAFGQDLTPEQLAWMRSLLNQEAFDTYNGGDSGKWTTTPALRQGSAGGKFGPSIVWEPNRIVSNTPTEDGFDYIDDPSGAGRYYIYQPRNVSTWGNSDVTDRWDGDTGKWLGASTGATGLRSLANFVATAAAMYGGVSAMGAAGSGAAATGAGTTGAGTAAAGSGAGTAAGTGGLNWGAIGSAAAKNAAINAGMTLAQGGDLSDALKSGALGAVTGGAGGAMAGYGVNPMLAQGATGALGAAARGGDGSDILRGAAGGAISGGIGQLGQNYGWSPEATAAARGAAGAAVGGGDGRDILRGAATGYAGSAINNSARGNGYLSGQDGLQTEPGFFAPGGQGYDAGGGMDYFSSTFGDGSGYTENAFGDTFGNTPINAQDYWGFDPSIYDMGGGYDSQQGSGIDWGSLLSKGAGWLTQGGGKDGKGASPLAMLLGGLLGAQGGKDQQQTSSRDPWAPMQPYLLGLAEDGRKLYNQYTQQPFSPAQQTAYGNVGGLLDVLNLNAGGLLQGMQANATGQNQFVRGQPRQLIGSAPIDGMAFQPGLLGNFGTRRG